MTEAKTQYGNIGVKVWIYRGEILPGRGPGLTASRHGRSPVRLPPAPAGGAPAAPVTAAEKKAKGWRRVPREEASAIAAVTPEGDSPEEYAGADRRRHRTAAHPGGLPWRKRRWPAAGPDVEEVPPATPKEPEQSDDEPTSPGESA